MDQSAHGLRVRTVLAMAGLIIAALAGLQVSTAHAASAWTPQVSGATDALQSVAFPDASHGWAVGFNLLATGIYHVTILATTDGGAHWNPQSADTTQPLNSVAFVSTTHGWAVGGDGTILATTDGGAHWTAQSSGTTRGLRAVTFADTDHGWAVGGSTSGVSNGEGIILATVDGGAHWTAQPPGIGGTPLSVDFVDAARGWTVGGDMDVTHPWPLPILIKNYGIVLATVDGGAHWTAKREGANFLRSVDFVDAIHGWAVGDEGTIISTTDGGSIWTTQTSGTTNHLNSVAFTDSTRGWAVGSGGTILATTDGGLHWTPHPSGTLDGLESLAFADPAHGWAVGCEVDDDWKVIKSTILAYGEPVDTTAPVTTAAVTPAVPDGAAGWYRTAPRVALSTDESATTYFRWDAAAYAVYTSTLTAPAGTHTLSFYSVDGAGNVESTKTVTFVVVHPSVIVLSTGSASIGYGASFVVAGTLKSDGVGLPGQQVILQSRVPGGSFRDTSYHATTGAGGAFSFSVRPTTKTDYRVRFGGSAGYAAAGPTTAVYARPKAYVRTPIARSTMRRTRHYTVYGYLKPRHTAGTYPVRIYKYRKVSGHWRSYGYIKAKVSNYSAYSKYARSLRLASRGKWRLRAYAPADSGHAATWSSGYDYVTVR